MYIIFKIYLLLKSNFKNSRINFFQFPKFKLKTFKTIILFFPSLSGKKKKERDRKHFHPTTLNFPLLFQSLNIYTL